MRTDPWKMLAQTPDVVWWKEPLPESTGGATYTTDGDVGVIRTDPSLSQRERREAMLHELIHHRDGLACQGRRKQWLDCQRIEDEVADSLVPPDELRVFWVRAERTGQNVHAHEVAEHFHVTEELAERAMHRLLQRLP